MNDDSVKYSIKENEKYTEIVEKINNNDDFLVSNILNHFGFEDLKNNTDDTSFKHLLGYIPNPEIKYGNNEFIKFLTTPILIFAILIIIGVPLANSDTKKVGLFWIVIIGLYALYTFKHCFFLSKLCMQFNTFLEYNLYKDKFIEFLNDDNTPTFFHHLIKKSDLNTPQTKYEKLKNLKRCLYVLCTYGFSKLIQFAIIPGLLFLIILFNLYDGYDIACYVMLSIILVIKFVCYMCMMWKHKPKIQKYYKLENTRISQSTEIYDEIYDTFFPPNSVRIGFHNIFSGGDSAFSSYLFTKTFTLIFGILMFIIGAPVYSIVLSLTLLYVSLNFIYNIVIFPLTKPETREKIFEIIKENGTLLALIFTGLTINSIYQSHIFGDNNKQIVGIMCAVYAILVLMHIGKNIRKTKNKTE